MLNTIRKIILFIFLAELISLLIWLFPIANGFVFAAICLLAIIIACKNLGLVVLIFFTELFIGSKGYLFHYEFNGIDISLRIALWLIILSVWFGQWLAHVIKNKKLEKMQFFNSEFSFYYLFLFFIIAWALLNGYLNHNASANIFFDSNNWFYFAIIFPIFDLIMKSSTEFIDKIKHIFLASALWLCLKTFLILFIFSHNIVGLVDILYRWIRDSGVGEITLIQGGFYRIFFQSHIYLLPTFFILLLWLTKVISNNWRENKKTTGVIFLALSVVMAVNLITFSRSNWIGLLCGIFLLMISYLFNRNWKFIGQTALIGLTSFVLALGLIVFTVKFPYPNPIGGFDTASLLSERASQISGEAGASSRWSLLPELWGAIKNHPVLGSGFGQTVTYISQDPRILEFNPKGEYTTYSFEWGWLDIWLKLGIFGLLSYLFLVAIIICKSYNNLIKKNLEHWFFAGLIIGLAAIATVNFFSPYMNHPLGIGFLILISALYEKYFKLDFAHLPNFS